MTFCQNCGVQLIPGAPTCSRCGKIYAQDAQAQFVQPPAPQYQQPYPIYPAAPPPAPPGTNICAVLGFVAAWLPIPVAWLVLSIIGIVQCRRTGEKGKGFAIAGIILRVLGTVLVVAAFAALIIYAAEPGVSLPEFFEWENNYSFTAMMLR